MYDSMEDDGVQPNCQTYAAMLILYARYELASFPGCAFSSPTWPGNEARLEIVLGQYYNLACQLL